MKNRVVGVNLWKGRTMKPSTALRTLVRGEVKRGRRRLLISSLRGVFDLFLCLSIAACLLDQIARQNRARAFEHRANGLRLCRRDGDAITSAALRGLTKNRFQRAFVN